MRYETRVHAYTTCGKKCKENNNRFSCFEFVKIFFVIFFTTFSRDEKIMSIFKKSKFSKTKVLTYIYNNKYIIIIIITFYFFFIFNGLT